MNKYSKIILWNIVLIIIILGMTLSVSAYSSKVFLSKDINNTKVMNILGEEITATYEYSYNDINVYMDNNNTEYLIKNGINVGFIKDLNRNNIMTISENVNQEQALSIANEFCNNEIINFNQYEFSNVNYIENYKEYSITYTKKIDKYDTMDFILIIVNTQGEITAFSAANQGEFDKYMNIKINIDEINEFVEDEIENKYEHSIETINHMNRTFKKIDNKLVLECVVEIIFNDNTKFGDSFLYYL